MLCRIDVCRTSYSHWLSVMSGTCRRCYCSCGLAQDMKHCCWVGLLLGYYSTAWRLSPNYSKRQQCCVTDWTTFHCKYRTDRAKARPQKCCHVCYYQGIRNGKKPDSLSLPRCCPSQPSLPYHKKLCYCRQTTRRAVSVEILSTTAQLYEQVVQQIKVIELERHINRCVINYMCPSTTRQLS